MISTACLKRKVLSSSKIQVSLSDLLLCATLDIWTCKQMHIFYSFFCLLSKGNPFVHQRTGRTLQRAGLRKRFGTTESKWDPFQRTDVENPTKQIEWDSQRERTRRENNNLIVFKSWIIFVFCALFTLLKHRFRGQLKPLRWSMWRSL